MKFIDIHNHILPQIDDGAKTEQETLRFLKMADENHIEKLIVTPHFKVNMFENTREIIQKKVEDLNQIIHANDIKVKVYPGCEIFLTKNTSNLLNNQKLQTLNNSSYILVETHRLNDFWVLSLKEALYNLSVDGYKVILAHPERYDITYKNPNYIYELVKEGHYMQVNVNSLNNRHPNHKIVKKLLKHRLVHFIASDAHDLKHRPLILEAGYDFIKKQFDQKYADDLFYNNPLRVISNEDIKINDYQKIKTKSFKLF
ncbi:capsular biosynthesis protein CpsB [Mycoplasmatota bacterium]|nr:capsular biosynthesis protein CpsB [Mycoplasmatota bacterium]